MGVSQNQKMMISLMSGLLFFIVANPETFKFVRNILGGWVSSPTGCPTVQGLLVHTVVYFLLTWALMNLKINKTELAEGDAAAADAAAADAAAAAAADAAAAAAAADAASGNTKAPEGPSTNESDPQSYNADDVSGVEESDFFNLNLGSLTDSLGKYNKCACADGTEVLVLK
jgi:hypothetical protein